MTYHHTKKDFIYHITLQRHQDKDSGQAVCCHMTVADKLM